MRKKFKKYATLLLYLLIALLVLGFYISKNVFVSVFGESVKDVNQKHIRSSNEESLSLTSATECDVNFHTSKVQLQGRLEEWRKRLQLLDNFCSKHPEFAKLDYEKRKWTTSRTIVDQQHQVVFQTVAKVGSSALERIFSHILVPKYQNWTHDKVHKIPDVHDNTMERLYPLSKYQQNKLLKTYYKFVFVRDPFARLVSAFRSKFITTSETTFRRKYGPEIIVWNKSFPDNVNPNTSKTIKGKIYTFRSFFRYLAMTDPKKYNHHWMLLSDVVQPCFFKYDFIGKLETFVEDFAHISGCKLHEGRLQSFYPDKEPNTISVYDEFYETVDDNDLVRVYEIFQRDFEIFGYPMPPVVQQAIQRLNS